MYSIWEESLGDTIGYIKVSLPTLFIGLIFHLINFSSMYVLLIEQQLIFETITKSLLVELNCDICRM